MSKELVVLELNPKGAPKMNESLAEQGHVYVLAHVRENGKDGKQTILHVTKEQLANATLEGKAKEKPKSDEAANKATPKNAAAKAPAKKAAAKAPAKKAAAKAPAKKAAAKK
jgi:hypothetical protein